MWWYASAIIYEESLSRLIFEPLLAINKEVGFKSHLYSFALM